MQRNVLQTPKAPLACVANANKSAREESGGIFDVPLQHRQLPTHFEHGFSVSGANYRFFFLPNTWIVAPIPLHARPRKLFLPEAARRNHTLSKKIAGANNGFFFLTILTSMDRWRPYRFTLTHSQHQLTNISTPLHVPLLRYPFPRSSVMIHHPPSTFRLTTQPLLQTKSTGL